MERPGKVATPLEALTVAVPERTPPGPALLRMARVTEAEELVTVLPAASRTATAIEPRLCPEAALTGWTVKARAAAGPGEMVEGALAALRAPEEAWRV